jgi:serine/threonine-protein kinase
MESAFAPGYVLADKYELVECIGRGGMGEVWRALHRTLNAQVAIKFIHTELTGTSDAAARFMREAQAAAALRSPNVVQILDYGVDGSLAYMVMELLEGESLADRIQRAPVHPTELARVMTHVARALSRAHESGIVHRDLKPDNIFLTHADDELIAKVLDFGIAKVQANTDVDTATRTGAILGTPYYMSPEQAEGNCQVDHRTDIWAMGVIAYECLVGERPFDSEAFGNLLLKICTKPIPVPSQVNPKVPTGFDEWFAAAVNRDVEQRFNGAKDAADALGRLCYQFDPALAAPAPLPHGAHRPVFTPSGTAVLGSTNQPLARTVDPRPRRRLLVPALGAGLAFILLLGAGVAYFARDRLAEAAAPPESASAAPEPISSEDAEPASPPSSAAAVIADAAAESAPEPEQQEVPEKPAVGSRKTAPLPASKPRSKPPAPKSSAKPDPGELSPEQLL